MLGFRIRLGNRRVVLFLVTVCLSIETIGTRAADFVSQGAVWHYFKGTQEPTPNNLADWRAVDFDDSAWATGRTPVFYGEPLTGTEVGDMRGNNTSIYFRCTFDVANPADVQTLTVRAPSDAGFVVWIDG